jgi:deoxyribonuclease-4
MKPGSPGPVGAHVSIAGELPKAVDRAVNMGAECIQIFSSAPQQWAVPNRLPADIRQFNQSAKRQDITPIFVHANYLINLASTNQELIKKSVAAIIADFTLAKKIHAIGVVVHLGSHQGRGYQAVRQQLADLISEIINNSPQGPQFIIENSAGQKGKLSSHINEIYDLVTLLDKKLGNSRPRKIAICLDSCHLWGAGYDLTDKAYLNALVDMLADTSLLERVVLLHINDSRDPLGSGRDRHANLGEGNIGLEGLRNLVSHQKLTHLPKIIETPGFEKQGPDANNIKILKSLSM